MNKEEDEMSEDWWSIVINPPESGWYLLGHSGYQIRAHYFSPNDGPWCDTTEMGWKNDDLAHGPTHWMKAPVPPESNIRRWPRDRKMAAHSVPTQIEDRATAEMLDPRAMRTNSPR